MQIEWNVIGVEPNSSACKIAKVVSWKELLRDIAELQLKNYVETFIMLHVLEYVPNLKESLKKTHPIKKNEVLIIGVLNSKSYGATKNIQCWTVYNVSKQLYNLEKSSLKLWIKKMVL